MAWFWQKKRVATANKTKALSQKQIDSLNRLGDDFINFLAAGQRKNGAVPTKLVDSASRGEIRAAIIENLIVLLQKGLPFKMQIECMDQISSLFVSMKLFDSDIDGGRREVESDQTYDRANKLWEEFQDLIIRDGGRRFEVNEDEIRERIVIKLIEET